MLKYLITRIQELTKNNSNECGKYMLMLETLSSNRNLENTVEEMTNMLRDMNIEKSIVYRKGEARGEARGKLESAKIMIKDFSLSIEEVSQKLDIPIENLKFLQK